MNNQESNTNSPMSGQQYPGYQYNDPQQYQQPQYQQPQYQQQYPQQPQYPQQQYPTQYPQQGAQLPFIEQSYIENILRLNKGKEATVYMNFENSQWGSKVFKGIIEAAGKDHIILSDRRTGMRYVLLSIYLNYITFDEEIEYSYPFDTTVNP